MVSVRSRKVKLVLLGEEWLILDDGEDSILSLKEVTAREKMLGE